MNEPLRAIAADDQAAAPKIPPVVVKKYANRRLYNTEASSYVTLDHLASMVKDGRDFVVYDAKTGEDITRQVLTQIIMEEENKGTASLLPISFLRQLISFYGDNLQAIVPRYLEHTMGTFARQQEQMRQAMRQTMELFPFAPNLEEMGKQNMAMMERAFSLFAPFYGRPGGAPASTDTPEVAALKAEMERLRAQIEELLAKKQG
jgi:polyhydroxyalkanoate synthesis repressor PhaR